MGRLTINHWICR